jgi:hypothetical protein
MKKVLIAVTAIAALACTTKDKLTGRWESRPSAKGNVTSALFRADNSFEGYVNRKAFVSGYYTLQDSIFSFTDNGCNGVRGTYKIIFFAGDDSIRFVPVTDSCTERKQSMSTLVFGRVKELYK